MEYHLYEIVLESPVMWVKIQAPCKSHWQANAMLEARFGGTTLKRASAEPPMPRLVQDTCLSHSPCRSGSPNVLSG